jgi:3-oxoacyl-[acyl-carrier-protein] synthase-1
MASVALLANVVSAGARCPLGLSALQMTMCVRARKSEPRSTDLLDKRGREVGACLTPGLPEDLYGYERMLALAAPALREAVGVEAGGWPLALALALPEAGRPDDHARLNREVIGDLAARSGVALDGDRSIVIRAGHAAGALAMEAAVGMLASGAQAALVGGVDSYFHPDTLRWLDEECRLHALDAENGLVPSEGAAFLLLSRAGARLGGSREAGQGRPLAVVRFAEGAREEAALSGEPNVGRAMTELLRRASEHVRDRLIPWALTDLNGERHRLREWMFASSRGALADDAVHSRFVEDLGDMGAATGPSLAAMVCTLWRVGCAPARSAVVALHSEGVERGAFVLEEAGS